MKRKIKILLLTLTIFSFFPGFFGPETLNISFYSRYQTFEGFGVSGAWWAQAIGKDTAAMKKVSKLLFSKEDGLGITIYRYNAGAGSGKHIKDDWRKTESYLTSKKRFNRYADKYAVKTLKQAVNDGVEKVVIFANSAPAHMTISNSVSGGEKGESNLNPKYYNEFSNYLINIARTLKSKGIPVREISPINEPQWDWNDSKNQEGCHFTPEETVGFLKVFVPLLRRRLPNIKPSVIESGEWKLKSNKSYLETIFSDKLLNKNISEYYGHSYWTSAYHKQTFADYFYKKYPDKKLVMSEWTEMKSGRDMTMDSALKMASVIIEDLTILNVISWQYWIAVSKYDWRDGLLYADMEKGKWKISIPKRYYAFMHFSKFIQLNSVRLDTGNSNSVAFLSENKEITVIAYNDSFIEKNFSISAGRNLFFSELYITDKKRNAEKIPLPENGIITLPANSIITAIFKVW